MERPEVSSRELIDQIRRKARSDIEFFESLQPIKKVLESPELSYLTRHYVLRVDVPSKRSGPYRRLKGLVKRWVRTAMVKVLENYLNEERQYLSHNTQFHVEMGAKLDVLGFEVRQMAPRLEELRQMTYDLELAHRLLEERLDRLEKTTPE